MKQYLELIQDVLDNGIEKEDRTGTGTISVFGRQARYNLADGFPMLTTKKLHWPSIVHELLWFISGSTNIKYLTDNGIRIWNEWADEDGNLGPIYGKQWRDWEGEIEHDYGNFVSQDYIDQLEEVIKSIKSNPDSRRHIVTAWNPGQLDMMALPPCHMMYQFYVANGRVSCMMYQRSCDLFLGVPFNIASYSLLTHMIAHLTGLKVGEFIHTMGDLHIYKNHLEQVKLQLTREPTKLPTLEIDDRGQKSIDDFIYNDFVLVNYAAQPHIKGKVAV